MIFYRRNTFSDKIISFMSIMIAILLGYNNFQRFQVLGSLNVLDLIGTGVSLMIGILFLYTSKFKYLEVTDKELIRYTWFILKKPLDKAHIQDITTKQRYYIISKSKGQDIWLSKFYIRDEDDQRVNEALKQLLEGK